MTGKIKDGKDYNPFRVLGLEKEYSLGVKMLEKAYFEAQRQFHPDQFARAPAEVRIEAAEKSAIVNQAYRFLKDPLWRAEWLLKEAGVEPLSHDPIFLTDVMAWRERLEAEEDIREELLEIEKGLFKNIEEAFEKKDYAMANTILYRLTYVRKLLKEIRHAPSTA